MKTVKAGAPVATFLVTLLGAAAPTHAAQTGTAPKVLRVECAKGDSIQAAVKSGTDPIVIEIVGFCAEHVVVDRAGVTLRGASGNPEQDGIAGVRPGGGAVDLGGELGLVHVEAVARGGAVSPAIASALPVYFRDLGIRDSPGIGLFASESSVGLENVRVERSAGLGVYFTSTSFGVFDRLLAADNGGGGVRANRESLINCGSCDVTGNGGWSVLGTQDGRVALLDSGSGGGPSYVSGGRGIAAWYGGRVWLDPDTEVVAASGRALWAVQSGGIEAFGAVVDGAIWCGLGGELYLTGLEQRSNNGFNNFYTECSAHFEGGDVAFVGTTMFHAHATGALFDDGSASFDDLVCQTGGDFVCYGAVTKSSSTCGGCP